MPCCYPPTPAGARSRRSRPEPKPGDAEVEACIAAIWGRACSGALFRNTPIRQGLATTPVTQDALRRKALPQAGLRPDAAIFPEQKGRSHCHGKPVFDQPEPSGQRRRSACLVDRSEARAGCRQPIASGEGRHCPVDTGGPESCDCLSTSGRGCRRSRRKHGPRSLAVSIPRPCTGCAPSARP